MSNQVSSSRVSARYADGLLKAAQLHNCVDIIESNIDELVSVIETTVAKPRSHPTEDYVHATNEVCSSCLSYLYYYSCYSHFPQLLIIHHPKPTNEIQSQLRMNTAYWAKSHKRNQSGCDVKPRRKFSDPKCEECNAKRRRRNKSKKFLFFHQCTCEYCV